MRAKTKQNHYHKIQKTATTKPSQNNNNNARPQRVDRLIVNQWCFCVGAMQNRTPLFGDIKHKAVLIAQNAVIHYKTRVFHPGQSLVSAQHWAHVFTGQGSRENPYLRCNKQEDQGGLQRAVLKIRDEIRYIKDSRLFHVIS